MLMSIVSCRTRVTFLQCVLNLLLMCHPPQVRLCYIFIIFIFIIFIFIIFIIFSIIIIIIDNKHTISFIKFTQINTIIIFLI